MIINKNYSSEKKIRYAFLDQIVFSGFNFLLGVLIVRFSGLEIFGKFSFFWLLYLFVFTIQNSLILTPLISKYYFISPKNKNNYVSSIFLVQIIFCILSTLTLIFFFNQTFFFKNYLIDINFLNHFILMTLFSQFYHFNRKLLYCEKRYKKIFFVDLFIYTLSLFILIFIYLNYELNLNYIFLTLTLIYFLGFTSNLKFYLKINFYPKMFYKIFKQNYNLGKWLVITSIGQWFTNNLWILNTGIILGNSSLGVIRMCQSIIQSLNIVYQVLENIMPEKISTKIKSGDKKLPLFIYNFIKSNLKYILFLTIFIIFFSKIILNILYGLQMSSYNIYLIIMSLTIPFIFARYPINLSLKSLDKTKYIFISNLIPILFTIISSKYLIEKFSIYGSSFGILFTQIFITIIMMVVFNKLYR